MASRRSYRAGQNIEPSRFVKLSAGNDHTIVKCVANDAAIGVSHEGTRSAPLPGVTPMAANTGESCRVYGDGEPCEVEAGAAINAGDYLKPDANAMAVPAGVGEHASAQAASSAAAGELVKVNILQQSAV